MAILGFGNRHNKKYRNIFRKKEFYDDIQEIIEPLISNNLKNYKEEIIDVFYSIYKESNLGFNDFVNRLTNRLRCIEISNELGVNESGAYRDFDKKLLINDLLFDNTEELDFFGNEILDSNDKKLLNEYRLIRTFIHEGLHCIANNDLNNLVILDELKTVQLENTIFNKYFKDYFKEGKDISKKNERVLDYYVYMRNSNENEYYKLLNADFRGYSLINVYANIVDFLDNDFNNIYWGNLSFFESNLNNDYFYEFSEKAIDLVKSYGEGNLELNKNLFYETINSFYKCIDYQIRNEYLNKDNYIALKNKILEGNFFNFQSENSNKRALKVLNFDKYFLNKIEEQNPNLDINNPIDERLINVIETHFREQNFEVNINTDNGFYL